MFIYNFKIRGGIVLRLILILLSIFMLAVFLLCIYRIFIKSGKFKLNDDIKSGNITKIEASNYTNILQAVHDNPDSYTGMKVNFTGYMYRLFDFDEEQFVIARDMFINNEKTQTVVVGFLCQYKDADDFENGQWVDLTGVIEMGKYHNKEIPILKVINMEETQKPDNELVNPPENSYIPTSGIF